MSAVLLDTCAVIWLANGDRMSPEAIDVIRAAQAVDGAFVSPITAWEIATKKAKGRLELDAEPQAWFDRFLALPGVRLAEMSPRTLIASTRLPGDPPSDPADRIIIATARTAGLPVVTRDQRILPYLAAGHGAVVRC